MTNKRENFNFCRICYFLTKSGMLPEHYKRFHGTEVRKVQKGLFEVTGMDGGKVLLDTLKLNSTNFAESEVNNATKAFSKELI